MSKSVINTFLKAKEKGDKASAPKVSFTMNLLEWLPATGFDYEVISSSLPYLRCRVRSGGTKTLNVVKRSPSGKLHYVKVCRVGELTLADVTYKYHQIIREVIDGTHSNIQPDKITLSEALEAYFNDTQLAPRSMANYSMVVNVYLSDWADKPLIEITTDMVKQRFRLISERKITNEKGQSRGGEYAANTTMKVVRALFNFMSDETEGNFPVSPTKVLNPSRSRRKKKAAWNEEKPREGRIELAQLPQWWATVELLPSHYLGNGELARDYLQFILLTGMRRREATSLEWSDITKTTITVRQTKNGNPLVLPITPHLKTILDRSKQRDRPFPVSETRRFMNWVIKRSGVTFTIHDLRRTFAGYAEHYCELPEKIISVLLNHTTDRTVTSRYIGDVGLSKKAEKLAIVQGFILNSATATKATVTTLERGSTNNG